MSGLKSWRELLATPATDAPVEGGGGVSRENAPDKSDKRTNAVLLRVDLSETDLGQITESSDKSPSRLVAVGQGLWGEAAWATGLCCFCSLPVAPGDRIACTEHRARIDAEPMPWDAPKEDRP